MFSNPGPVNSGTFHNGTSNASYSPAAGDGVLDVSRIDRVTARMGHEILSYLGEKLSPQDIAFIHARGSRGKPHLAEYCFDGLVECLYGGSPGQSPAKAAAYYTARLGLETETRALTGMLANEALAKEAGDKLVHELDALRDIKEQGKRSREQMAKLLEEAKRIFTQCGIHEEAQVVESVQIIDAVLWNIDRFGEPDMSAPPTGFCSLYAKPVKDFCEYEVAVASDPWPILDAFRSPAKPASSLDERWLQGTQASARQARLMAGGLKEILAPYAKVSSQDEQSGEIYAAMSQALRNHR